VRATSAATIASSPIRQARPAPAGRISGRFYFDDAVVTHGPEFHSSPARTLIFVGNEPSFCRTRTPGITSGAARRAPRPGKMDAVLGGLFENRSVGRMSFRRRRSRSIRKTQARCR